MTKKYNNPPLIEALCEIYFQGSNWDSTFPGIFYDLIKQQYPGKREIKQIGIESQLADQEQGIRMSSGNIRMQFFNEDKSQLVQIEPNLLVINQFRPYSTFQEWKPVIENLLKIYWELATPVGISKMGLRYINRIVIPADSVEMAEYFKLFPEVPEALGQTHGEFMMRMSLLPKTNQTHRLIATLGSTPESRIGGAVFLLDLYDIAILKLNSLEINQCLEHSHENIKHCFENSITDKTRQLFEEVQIK